MFVYLAYFLIIMHVMLGVIQYETNPVFVLILMIGSFTIITLHVAAGTRELRKDNIKYGLEKEGFVKVCECRDIEETGQKCFVRRQNASPFLKQKENCLRFIMYASTRTALG